MAVIGGSDWWQCVVAVIGGSGWWQWLVAVIGGAVIGGSALWQ